MAHHVAGDDRNIITNAKHMERQSRTLVAPTRGDGPRNSCLREIRQQFLSARQCSYLRRVTLERFAVYLMYALSLFCRNVVARLARQRVHEETAAHANLSMNAPHGQMNSASLERLAPREHVLIDAVDECSIKIEEKRLSRPTRAFSIKFLVVRHTFIL